MTQETRRLARRAQRRWLVVVTLALALFVVPAYVIWWRKPAQVAHISLAFVPRNGVGYSNREVRAYVDSVLLSRHNLYDLIVRLDLVPHLERRDLDTVVEMLRGRIEVEVHQQYAPEDASGEQSPGARVLISVGHVDPLVAGRIADGILQLITTTEQAMRERQAGALRAFNDAKRELLSSQRTALVTKLAAFHQRREVVAAGSLEGRQIALDLALLREQIERLDALSQDMVRLATTDAYALGAAADASADLQVLDVIRPNIGHEGVPLGKVGISAIVLLMCLLAAGAVVAAFDHRVDTPADVLRLGALGLGTWQAAPGRSNVHTVR